MDVLLRFEDDNKQVEYKKFLDGLNWRENQIPAFQTIRLPLKVKPLYLSKGTAQPTTSDTPAFWPTVT